MFDKLFAKTTGTDIAQWAVNKTVAVTVGSLVATQITEHTELEEDALRVVVPSAVVGWLVADQTDRITDPMIEKIALWRAARKAAKNTVNNLTVVQ